MAARRNTTDDPNDSDDVERAKIAASRAEVVDILAGAVFTMLIEGHSVRASSPTDCGPDSADDAATV